VAPQKSSLENRMIKVGMVCPCSIEYEICCNVLELTNEEKLAGRVVVSKAHKNIDLLAINAGPGKIQCASAAQMIIDNFRPDYLIDVGGAGALSKELEINDIICVENSLEYDVCDIDKFSHLASDLTASTVLTKLSSFKSKIMEQFSDWVALHGSARLVIGDLASGEKNITGGKLKQDLYEKLGAIACNWETSAVLKTAQLNNIKTFSFRVITDTADKDMKEELQNNWEGALKILYTVLKEFIFHGWLHRISKVLCSP